MTVSVSTLLTGRCGRNCLYLNSLDNKSLAKRSFRKVVLADSCRGFNLVTHSSSVSYHGCTPNRACQEGRKSGLSLFGFRKSICACPRHMSTPHVHAGVAAACPCGRTLRSWSDVFPCGTAVRVRWTGVFVPVVPALWHTCVMTVSVSTLLTGRCGRNCLYLN